ncbi:MAG TPA: sugar ABC transporter permease [Trueperaceae bacterium]
MPYLLLAPSFLLLGVVLIYPLVYNVYLSFFAWRYINPSATRFIGFDNYATLLGDGTFWAVSSFTALFVVATIALEFVLGLTGALLLGSLDRSRKWFATIILLPYLIAPIAVGLDWRLLWNHDFGLINWFVGLIGIQPVTWLGDSQMSRLAVVVTEVWRSTPFVTIILLAGLTAIPKEVLEAARSDGVNAWQELWHIILPLLRPSLTIALLFQTILKLRVFDLIYIMTGGGPGNSTTPYGIHIYRTYFRYFDGGQAATIAVVLMVLGAAISFVYIRLVYREVQH